MCATGQLIVNKLQERNANERGNTVKPVIGVLGGLGPQTTAEFYLQLVQFGTRIARPTVCLWSLPLDPEKEREYIAAGKHRRYYHALMSAGLRALRAAGSSFVVIPCNTVHEFHPVLTEEAEIPIVNLIDVVAEEVARRAWTNVFVLATSRTIKTRLYQDALSRVGVSVALPTPLDQARLDQLIQGLLGDRQDTSHQRFLETMIERAGSQHIVLGCTDLQLVFSQDSHCIDSMNVLARHTANLI